MAFSSPGSMPPIRVLRWAPLEARRPAPAALLPEDVHIWLVPVDVNREVVSELGQWLVDSEKERAERFYFPRHRDEFILKRGATRGVLASYLNTGPAQVQFCYGRYGKPALVAGGAEVRFNVSRSHGLCLVAVSRNRDLGVDIEHIDADFPCDLRSIERLLTASELEALGRLQAVRRRPAFFRLWVRKEAYVKALGKGLQHDLSSFNAASPPVAGGRRWLIQDVSVPKTFAAALAVEDTEFGLACRAR